MPDNSGQWPRMLSDSTMSSSPFSDTTLFSSLCLSSLTNLTVTSYKLCLDARVAGSIGDTSARSDSNRRRHGFSRSMRV